MSEVSSEYIHKHKFTFIMFRDDVKALAFQKVNLYRATFVIPYRITAPTNAVCSI